ncbi:MAG: SBBP repeat-containing protein [Bryobacteraceae bacterium]
MTSDAQGNLYVAGSTTSPDLPVLYAAQPQLGESQLMRSVDRGATWTKVTAPPAAPLWIQPDPVSASILFAGTAQGIYRAQDGGQTWKLVYAWQVPSGEVTSMGIDPANHLHLVATVVSGLVILSLDGGNSWSTITGSNYAGPVWPMMDPFGSGTVLLSGFSPMISTDGGHTFSEFGPPGGGERFATFDTVHRGWIWMGVAYGTMGQLYLSTDGGATWTAKPNAPSAIQWLVVDPELPGTLYATVLGGLYVSRDDAATWISMHLPPPAVIQGRLAFLSRQCGPGGGLFAISDLGATSGNVEISQDFATWQPAPFAGAIDLAAGAGCAVYAARTLSGDAFVAKLAPGGKQPQWVTFLGGEGADAATALAADSYGNVYVAGTTGSLDFPATTPRLGIVGSANAFLTKFGPAGVLLSSVVFGGESVDTPLGVAVDSSGNPYVIGNTSSTSFPVTPGALDTQAPASYPPGGFVAKFRLDASLAYATFLGGATAYAVIVDANGNPVIGGSADSGPLPGKTSPAGQEAGFLLSLDPSGSQITNLAYIGGQSNALGNPTGDYETTNLAPRFGPYALAGDAQGNLYVEGVTAAPGFPVTAGAYVSPLRSVTCNTGPGFASAVPPADVYVMKLAGIGQPPTFSALLGAQCAGIPGSLVVDGQGDPTFSLATGPAFPLIRPVTTFGGCNGNSAVVAQLSADGSTLRFSTYLDACGAPPLAITAGTDIFAAENPASAGVVVKLPPRAVGRKDR